jgi:hypothetical protein
MAGFLCLFAIVMSVIDNCCSAAIYVNYFLSFLVFD